MSTPVQPLKLGRVARLRRWWGYATHRFWSGERLRDCLRPAPPVGQLRDTDCPEDPPGRAYGYVWDALAAGRRERTRMRERAYHTLLGLALLTLLIAGAYGWLTLFPLPLPSTGDVWVPSSPPVACVYHGEMQVCGQVVGSIGQGTACVSSSPTSVCGALVSPPGATP